MQIEIFEGIANKYVCIPAATYRTEDMSYSQSNLTKVQAKINEFIKGKKVIDIKINTFTSHHHDNGGDDTVKIVYTVMYE